MKLQDINRDVLNNLDNSVSFSLSQKEEDQALVMDLLLSKMYATPTLSACRELICNAIDANIEAGNANEPVRVEHTRGILSITDRGPGLSEDRIVNVYTKFGSSTKREDNTAIGGFGIGAKSVFCISDTLTLITTCDGYTYNYILWLDEKKIPRISLVGKEKTNSPTGTTIQIPIRTNRVNDCMILAQTLAAWSKTPIVVIENEVPLEPRQDAEYIRLDDRTLFKNGTASRDIQYKVLIGGVLYPYTQLGTKADRYFDLRLPSNSQRMYFQTTEYSWGWSKRNELILEFDIGELTLSASREYILQNEQNLALIQKRLTNCCAKLENIQNRLNSYPTWKEYVENEDFHQGVLHSLNARRIISPGTRVIDVGETLDEFACIQDVAVFKDGKQIQHIDLTQITFIQLLRSNLYVVRPKDELVVKDEHQNNYMVITVRTFQNKFCETYHDAINYPLPYLERQEKLRIAKATAVSHDGIEGLAKSGKLRYVDSKLLKDAKTTLSVAKVTRECNLDKLCVYAYSDSLSSSYTYPCNFLLETLEAFKLEQLYILPPDTKEPKNFRLLTPFLEDYIKGIQEELGDWFGFICALLNRVTCTGFRKELPDLLSLAEDLNNQGAVNALKLFTTELSKLRAIKVWRWNILSEVDRKTQGDYRSTNAPDWICNFGIPLPEDDEVRANYHSVVKAAPSYSPFWRKVILRAYRGEM